MKIGKYDLSNPYDRKQFWNDARAKAKPIAKGILGIALFGALGYIAYKGCASCAKKKETSPKNPVPVSDTVPKVDTTKNIENLTFKEWKEAKEIYAKGRAYMDSIMEENRKEYSDYFDKKEDKNDPERYPVSNLEHIQVPPGFVISD